MTQHQHFTLEQESVNPASQDKTCSNSISGQSVQSVQKCHTMPQMV